MVHERYFIIIVNFKHFLISPKFKDEAFMIRIVELQIEDCIKSKNEDYEIYN